jgi:hypothetical protein
VPEEGLEDCDLKGFASDSLGLEGGHHKELDEVVVRDLS